MPWTDWSTLEMSLVASLVAIGVAVVYKATRFARSEVDLQLARLGEYKEADFAGKVCRRRQNSRPDENF